MQNLFQDKMWLQIDDEVSILPNVMKDWKAKGCVFVSADFMCMDPFFETWYFWTSSAGGGEEFFNCS